MVAPRRILLYVSLGLVIGSLLYLLGTLIWAYRLDDDFSGRYACCTQEASAAFHARFWWKFFIAVKLGSAGCLGLAATLATRTLLKLGLGTLAAAATGVLLLMYFPIANLHGWSGATALTIVFVAFCSGLGLVLIGAVRVGWLKLHPTAR
jgi:hypothetical protein